MENDIWLSKNTKFGELMEPIVFILCNINHFLLENSIFKILKYFEATYLQPKHIAAKTYYNINIC